MAAGISSRCGTVRSSRVGVRSRGRAGSVDLDHEVEDGQAVGRGLELAVGAGRAADQVRVDGEA